MLRVLTAVLTLGFGAAMLLHAQEAPPTKKPDPFASIRFMLGSWEGTGEGEPGVSKVERTYAPILNGRFLQVTNRSTYAAQEKNPKGEVHEDIGMFSYDRARKAVVFRQFHVEGFVNHYMQRASEDPNVVVFESESIENIPAGFRARETYTRVSDDEFTETFELAEPGADYKVYSKATLKRKK
jgi:hypothetical protein